MFRTEALALVTGAAVTVLSLNTPAATVHDETVDGDLGNSRSAPTALSVQAGSNDIFGVTTSAGGTDRDYATFLVPGGHVFSGLTVLPGTDTSGGVSFIGLQAGSEITANPNAPTPAPLLGWLHYGTSDIGQSILMAMGAEAGSIGFSGPLPAGAYSLWIQDFGPTLAPYGFRIEITAVPEPGTWLLAGAGLALLSVRGSRRVRLGRC